MSEVNAQFVGTWELVSWKCKSAQDRQWFPYGQDAVGYIVYTAEGLVSATLMKRDRARIQLSRQERIQFSKAVSDLTPGLQGADTETLASIEMHARAAMGYTAYCGPFSTSEDEVTHHVRTSLYPDWVGTDLVRKFDFTGDELRLTAEVDGLVDTLIWRRATSIT